MKRDLNTKKKDISNFLVTAANIEKSSGIDDVFFNKFDITWAKNSRDSFSKTTLIHPVEVDGPSRHGIVPDENIVYEFNNEWFRSDDFIVDHSEKYHVLFAGCSETEGVGSSLDTVWTKMLHESLKNDYDIGGFYSVAKSGFGWQKIITSVMIYIKKYGTPTHLFILLPNIDRMFKWFDSERIWRYIQRFPIGVGDPKEHDGMRSATEEEHMEMLINFIISWKLFEQYCKLLNIKVLWTTWDSEENENHRIFNQSENFFIGHTDTELANFIKAHRPDGKLEEDDLNRRDGHSGKLYHMFWKENFYNEINKRGLFND